MTPSNSNRISAALGLGLSLMTHLVGQAAPAPELRGSIVGGAAFSSGGLSFSQSITPASTASPHIVKSLSDAGSDGSYADGVVDVGFGSLRSYSDAHEVGLGGGAPQSHASSEFVDYIKPWQSSPIGFTAYSLTLALSGSHSLTDGFGPNPGYTAQGSVYYDIRDNQNGDVFAHGFYNTSDATPPGFVIGVSIAVPFPDANDDMSIVVSLDTYAYVGNVNPAYQTAVADYSHTLVVHLDAVTPGASTLGASGFDYATASSVPEPSSWMLLIAGGAALSITRRARPVAAWVVREPVNHP